MLWGDRPESGLVFDRLGSCLPSIGRTHSNGRKA